MKFVNKKSGFFIFSIIIILIVFFWLFGGKAQVWQDPSEGKTRADCENLLHASYGGVCTCVLKKVPWSNYNAWYGDSSSCVGSDAPLADGVCNRGGGMSNCASGNSHADYTCMSGYRCGNGANVLPPNNPSPDVDYRGATLTLDNAKSGVNSDGVILINAGDTYKVFGSFKPSSSGSYYVEAYQDKSTFSPLSLVSSRGYCDENIGTAGKWVTIDNDLSAQDFEFTLQDYGFGGRYKVNVHVTNGCSALELDDYKVYAEKTFNLKVQTLEEKSESTSVDNKQTTGIIDILIYSGIGFILVLVILIVLLVTLSRRHKR